MLEGVWQVEGKRVFDTQEEEDTREKSIMARWGDHNGSAREMEREVDMCKEAVCFTSLTLVYSNEEAMLKDTTQKHYLKKQALAFGWP